MSVISVNFGKRSEKASADDADVRCRAIHQGLLVVGQLFAVCDRVRTTNAATQAMFDRCTQSIRRFEDGSCSILLANLRADGQIDPFATFHRRANGLWSAHFDGWVSLDRDIKVLVEQTHGQMGKVLDVDMPALPFSGVDSAKKGLAPV